MSIFEILILAIALGTDAFSVAVVIGAQKISIKEMIKISGITGVFHIIMPLLGLFTGKIIRNLIESYFVFLNDDIDYIFELMGGGILLLIGGYMIIETFLDSKKEVQKFLLTGWGLLVIPFSVSIDAFSVGISLGIIFFSLSFVLIVGITAAFMMGAGLYFGSVVGCCLKIDTQVWGGLALIILGLHFTGLF